MTTIRPEGPLVNHSSNFTQPDVPGLVLSRIFGGLDEATREALRPHLTWTMVELPGGEILFREGDTSSALFILISGRLEARVTGPDGLPQVVGEIGRGESVGEMGILNGTRRGATVAALRDSVLAQIDLATVRALLKAAPELALTLSRVIIERLQRRNTTPKPMRRVTNIAVVSVSEGFGPAAVLQPLCEELQRQQHRVMHLTSAQIDAVAGRIGAAQATDDDPGAHFWLVNYLNDLETRYALVFYEADVAPTAWTHRCLRQADEVVLLARATASPELSAVEHTCLTGSTTRVRQTLVLLHAADSVWPEGTLPFLARRPTVHRHHHVRIGHQADMARLGRFLSGTAVGLVLAGGGARGLAHIGVFRALEEAGVPIDCFGGTSIGAVLAACMACGRGWQTIYRESKRDFLSNPTSDFNVLPLISLLAGRKLDRLLTASFAKRHIEEMWHPFYCVSSNYTQACEVVHRRGAIKQAMLASMAIPGVFPPVVFGNDLLVDGSVFNNLPADIMVGTGVQTILAVDLRTTDEAHPDLAFTQMPQTWALLADRFRPLPKRRYPVPSLLTILTTVQTLTSRQKTSQVSGAVDVLFNPDVKRFGMLEWKAYDLLVNEGYRHAREKLARNPWPFRVPDPPQGPLL